ncbi:MAG TPA: cytochrome P450 [Ktedonobacteraceae bacterium]|nr:cytochrome P450 [Ktedonobacteraceae bacterium]
MSIEITQATIPTVPGLPLIGNLLDFRFNRLDLMLRMSRKSSDIGVFHLGSRTVVMLNTSELVHAALVDHASDFEKTPVFRIHGRPLLGNGLLTSENEFHKRQRKLVAPPFQHRRIASYGDIMVSYSEQIQQEWADGETIDIAREMMRLTLWIVGKTLFDADVLGEAEELGKALKVAMQRFNSEMSAVVHIPYTWPTPGNWRVRKAIACLDAIVYQMIEERRRSKEDRGDLLSMLLSARDEDDGSFMSDRQVRDEAMTILLAGHETTAVALTWTWYLLAQHPQVYTRMRDEVDRVLAGRLPTFADLPGLPYTLQVFKESIRLFPPAYGFARQAVRPVTIGNYHLAAGTLIAISPYAMHRRPDYFPEPERFDPERFTSEAEQRLPRHAYIPFGGGPRICIGNSFALMEGHLVLATLAQHVNFALVPGQRVELEPIVTLRPKNGIKMKVTHRF